MSPACPRLERIEELLALAPDDPRRAHLDECPRCRARIAEFTSFMEARPLPDGIRLGDARARLTEAVRREAEPAMGSARIDRPRSGTGFWDRISKPLWKPALGLAVGLLIVVAVGRVTDLARWGSTPIFRGGDAAEQVWLPAGVWTAAGELELHWPRTTGADGYRLLFYGSDLLEIIRIDVDDETRAATGMAAGTTTQFTLTADRVKRLGASGATIYCRVEALRDGDTVARSQPIPILLP